MLQSLCNLIVMKRFIFVTGNQNKAKELENYLGVTVTCQKLDLPEIQSLDLEEVAIAKAKKAYEIIKTPVLIEDTALTFKAMGKLPGPFIKYFLESLQNEGMTNLLNNYKNREATATTCFALAEENEVITFVGEVSGVIASQPRGDEGFGWDAIFIPDGSSKTWAEMNLDEKQQNSMRSLALNKLKRFLV